MTRRDNVVPIIDDSAVAPEATSAVRLRNSQGEKTAMLQTKDVLGRIKSELGLNTDGDLAEAMGLGLRRIHNWKHRNTLPTEEIVGLCGREGLDLQYILTGERSSFGRLQEPGAHAPPAQPSTSDGDLLACEDTSNTPRSRYAVCPCGQPRICPPYQSYDERGANGELLHTFTSTQIVDVLSPVTNWLIHSLGIQPSNFLLAKVVGDNMSPWLHDGDLVFCDTSLKATINGGCLLLRYADGTMLVRRMTRLPDGKLRAACDANCCEPEIVDPNDNDSYPIIVGRVIRRLVR